MSDLSITFQCRLKIVYCSGSEIQTGDTEGIQALRGSKESVFLIRGWLPGKVVASELCRWRVET